MSILHKNHLCFLQEADLNADGKIDWEEFLQMMIPGHRHTIGAEEAEVTSTTT